MTSACCRIRTRRGKVDLAARHYDQIDAAIFDAALRSVVVCHRVERRTPAVEMRLGGGRPAQALSQFYASIFAQLLQASQLGSKAKFDHAIECVTASPGYGELFFQLLFLIEAGVVPIAGQQFIVPA